MAKSKFSKRQIAGALLLSSTAIGTTASTTASANAFTDFLKNGLGKTGEIVKSGVNLVTTTVKKKKYERQLKKLVNNLKSINNKDKKNKDENLEKAIKYAKNFLPKLNNNDMKVMNYDELNQFATHIVNSKKFKENAKYINKNLDALQIAHHQYMNKINELKAAQKQAHSEAKNLGQQNSNKIVI